MTREEMYQLVWTKPMIQLAKDYGLSDVGLRKICVKHGIPTPPLGYWAKRQHGKKVIRPPLPPLKKGQSEHINLHVRPQRILSPEILETQQTAERELNQPENQIKVPTERPVKIHPVALACEKVLRKAKPDGEGFIECGGVGKINIKIGSTSTDRVIILIHSMLTAATERGHQLSSADAEIRIVVEEQPLAVRIHETKDKRAHVPTPEDLKRQAKEDEWQSRFNVDYRSNRKVYPAWDYSPSGRLVLEVSDPKQVQWRVDPVVGRWRDRAAKRLEEYLGEVMAAVKVGAAVARHQRAKEAEEALKAKEAEDRRREQDQQRRLLEKATKFLLEKADKHAQLMKLESLAAYLESKSPDSTLDKYKELDRAIEFVLVNMRDRLTAESLEEEITETRLLKIENWW